MTQLWILLVASITPMGQKLIVQIHKKRLGLLDIMHGETLLIALVSQSQQLHIGWRLEKVLMVQITTLLMIMSDQIIHMELAVIHPHQHLALH